MAEQFGRAARGEVARQVAERAAIEEKFPRRQVLIKIWAFGQVAYARPHSQIVQRPSENPRLARRRTQHSHQDFEGGRLARAVRPQKTEDLAGFDPQTQPVQRAQTPLAPEAGLVIMREVFDLDNMHSLPGCLPVNSRSPAVNATSYRLGPASEATLKNLTIFFAVGSLKFELSVYEPMI